jgi:two-component system OmpR family sensor kinase
LTRRLLAIAGVVFVLNTLAVGIYYGSDLPTLQEEVVDHQVELIEAALVGRVLPPEADLRQLYSDHPQAYGFALVDRGGAILDAMNPELVPAGAVEIFADDWITRLERPTFPLVIGGSEFSGGAEGLRVVFVMQDDPARLLWLAYLTEFYEHVWFPILPLVLVLLGANTFLVRRGLAPISAMAAWARALRPGAPTAPPDVTVPAEIADLVDATQRSVERLAQAFETEKRHSAEAAHALRTPVAVLSARVDALPSGEMADLLRSDIAALARTVRQVLASSRADALTPDLATLADLSNLAADVTAALAPFAYERGVSLSLVDPGVPNLVRADPEGVELALTNLVENAILHGGGPTVVISVGPGPIITVRDRGPGLPDASNQDRLFTPFWRGPAAPAGGAGLGLAIVARVQNAQGGTVTARNASKGGAEFQLGYQPAVN